MPDLVAIDLPAGVDFVTALRRSWDAGEAVLPLDPRLPVAMQRSLITAMGAGAVVDALGRQNLDGGIPVEAGDSLVVATSGTTGEPKGVVLTHDAVLASARITSQALRVDPARDRWLACLPVAHIGGLAVVTRALLTGTSLELHPRFDADACETAARNGVTLVSLVVTALARVDAALFRKVLLGGSAIPVERPPNTVATYGMTETGSGIVYEGRPLEQVELRTVDGEVQVRTPTALRCYRDGSSPLDQDGWLATGDAGEIGDDGTLTVHGRIAEVIVTGGEKVWPASVERLLADRPWVSKVAVVGRPDPEWGQRVTAVVVPVENAAVPDLDAVREALGESLPRYALPRAIEIVAALPETPSGKVIRDRL